jgi:hypothetical protein
LCKKKKLQPRGNVFIVDRVLVEIIFYPTLLILWSNFRLANSSPLERELTPTKKIVECKNLQVFSS